MRKVSDDVDAVQQATVQDTLGPEAQEAIAQKQPVRSGLLLGVRHTGPRLRTAPGGLQVRDILDIMVNGEISPCSMPTIYTYEDGRVLEAAGGEEAGADGDRGHSM